MRQVYIKKLRAKMWSSESKWTKLRLKKDIIFTVFPWLHSHCSQGPRTKINLSKVNDTKKYGFYILNNKTEN